MSNKLLIRAGIALLLLGIAYSIYQYRQPRFINGDAAPDLEVTTPSGAKEKLSDLRGKYVLLQFWGSWCGPCRKENPHLVAMYQKYKDKGFDIFSVGIEQRPESWQRAIEQDGLIWPHHGMESADFGGGMAKLYNIKSIPTHFLLNPQGVIIGVNLPHDQLEKMLNERSR